MAKEMTIKEAARTYGKSECWIRRQVHQGKLKARKELIAGSNIPRILIEVSSLDARKTVSRNRRTDGRNKWTVYATPSEYRKAQDALKAAGLKVQLVRANPPKSK